MEINDKRIPARRGLPILCGLLLASVGMNAGAAQQDNSSRAPAEVYGQVCAHCHTTPKAVGPPIDISFPESVRGKRMEYMRSVVRNGRLAMPAFRYSEISEDELDGLLKALVSGKLSDFQPKEK